MLFKNFLKNSILTFISVLRKRIKNFYLTCLYDARTIHWNILRKTTQYITTNTYQGRLTFPSTDEVIGKKLFIEKEYELDFIKRTINFLSKQNYIPENEVSLIDIGANIGMISIGMMLNGYIKYAIAIEPEPTNFSLLQKNVIDNGYEGSIFCYNFALSNENNKKTQLFLSNINMGDHHLVNNLVNSDKIYANSIVEIETYKLDDIIQSLTNGCQLNVSLVWIDVQGYEGYVFMGGKNFFTQDIPVVSEIMPQAIIRAGMKIEEYIKITKEFWNYYWVYRRRKFIKYPINHIYSLIDELDFTGEYENVIFSKR